MESNLQEQLPPPNLKMISWGNIETGTANGKLNKVINLFFRLLGKSKAISSNLFSMLQPNCYAFIPEFVYLLNTYVSISNINKHIN